MGNLYLISGDDLSSIQTTAKKIMHELVGPEPDEFSCEIIKEDSERSTEEILRSLMESLQTPSFLGGDKTIHLQNFSAFDAEPAKSVKKPNPTGALLRGLADFIEHSFPDDVNLVLSGPKVDKRKRLFNACKAKGKVELFQKPDIKDRRWRQTVSGLLHERASDRSMRLDSSTVEYMTEVIGAETGRIDMELEKILCYAGQTPTLQQVQEVCKGNREAYFFALTDAMGRRRLDDCMEALTQTMAHTKNEDGECIRLIRMTSSYFRKLLHARIAMYVLKANDGRALRSAVKRISTADREALKGNIILNSSDWQVGDLGDKASNYSGDELREALQRFAAVDRTNVSSSLPRRLVLETLIIQTIAGKANSRGAA